MKHLNRLIDAGLTFRMPAQGGIEVEGLKALPPDQSDTLRAFIRENKPEILRELQRGYYEIAAKEFAELCRMGVVRLHADDQGLWWSAPGYENDPGSLSFLADLWAEGVMILFEWKDEGKLDEFLCPRSQSSRTQAESDPRSATEPAKQAAPQLTQLQFAYAAADSRQQQV